MKLQDIKSEIGKHLSISDPYALDLVFATILSNTLLKGRIWLLLIGSSGSGKTSLVDPCITIPSCFFLDDASPNSFLSGFGGGKHSLLDLITLDKGTKKRVPKTIVFSDFTTILSKNNEQRGELLAQFRVIYDGKMNKGTGVGLFKWSGKIGSLCCATNSVYNHLEAGRAMGERFLYYTINKENEEDMLAKQDTTNFSPEEITTTLQGMYYEYCFAVKEYLEKNGVELKLMEEQTKRLHKSAIFCVKSKTDVRLDYKSGQVASMPQTAAPTRDYRAFKTLLHMAHIMDCYEANDNTIPVSEARIQMIEKCAYSAIATERRKILETLAHSQEDMTSHEIGKTHGVNLPKEAIEKFIAPLYGVQLVNRGHSKGNAYTWVIADKNTRDFILSVSSRMQESIPPSLDVNDEEISDEDVEEYRERAANNF